MKNKQTKKEIDIEFQEENLLSKDKHNSYKTCPFSVQ